MAERRYGQVAARLSALEEAAVRLGASRDEAQAKKAEAAAALASLSAPAQLTARLDRARASPAQARAEAAEARAAVQAMAREADLRARRRQALVAERSPGTSEPRARAAQIAEFEARKAEAEAEIQALAEAPDVFLEKRRALIGEIEKAEEARKLAADGALRPRPSSPGPIGRAQHARCDGRGARRAAPAPKPVSRPFVSVYGVLHQSRPSSIASRIVCPNSPA